MQAEGLVGAGSQKALQQRTEKQFGSKHQAFRAGYGHKVPVEQIRAAVFVVDALRANSFGTFLIGFPGILP